MRQFYTFYRHAPEFVRLLAGQIPWWHNILIFSKLKSTDEALFHLQNIRRHNWSRSVLTI